MYPRMVQAPPEYSYIIDKLHRLVVNMLLIFLEFSAGFGNISNKRLCFLKFYDIL